MSLSKKVGAAILVGVALLIVVHGIISRAGKPKVPAAILGQKKTLIDEQTLEEITLTLGEWDKLGYNRSSIMPPFKYKNPRTGKYAMVEEIGCMKCGKLMPATLVFCPRCGAAVMGAGPVSPIHPAGSSPSTPVSPK